MASRFSPLLLAFVTLAACGNEPSAPAPAPDAGDPLGGKTPMQVCLDLYLLCNAMGTTEFEIQKECIAKLTDATVVCDKQLAAAYACYTDLYSREGCGAAGEPCAQLYWDAGKCIWSHGCQQLIPGECIPKENPPEPPTCTCTKDCRGASLTVAPTRYQAVCTPSAAGSSCDCFVDEVMAGSCEQSDFVCDVWTSCCRKYFDL
jgi:hypothetical protein